MKQTIETNEEHAPRLAEWIKAGRGLAHWRSADLSDPGQTWTTPARQLDGTPTKPGHWKMEPEPAFVVESSDDVTVFTDKEVKRFHVAIKKGYGFRIECTDASSRKIKAAVAKAGPGAYYVFDYESQEAVIMAPDSKCTLTEWIARQN